MVKQIHIENYKSVQSLDIELGRLNVFIGANGCGKTNVLEAIALGSAAAADKLDNEFLGSRGIRTVQPNYMKSGFTLHNSENPIILSIQNHEGENIELALEERNHRSWDVKFPKLEKIGEQRRKREELEDIIEAVSIVAAVEGKIIKKSKDQRENEINKILKDIYLETFSPEILQFLIFAPENYFLRRFEEESQIKPLGIRGEGLFSHLVELELSENFDILEKIKEKLSLIDWFENFDIFDDPSMFLSPKKIIVQDRFIKEGLYHFDQRSANEGFLYLLFYSTLFISPYTPKFFAIDNIDNSLNPKLCSELTKMLAQLAKEHDKQAILTTHNPAVLDGLNLNDDEQRLFVIYRNADGHTKARRVFKKEMPEGMEPVKLSEQFLRVYLGGLNHNF